MSYDCDQCNTSFASFRLDHKDKGWYLYVCGHCLTLLKNLQTPFYLGWTTTSLGREEVEGKI